MNIVAQSACFHCGLPVLSPSTLSRMAVYTIGFFLCWAFAAASSAFTCFLQRGADEVNQ